MKKNSLIWTYRAVGKYKGSIAVLSLMQIFMGICSVYFAVIFRDLIDHAASGRMQLFIRSALTLIILELGQIAVDMLGRLLSEWTRASLENSLKKRLFSCLLHKDYAEVAAVHSGDWVTRLTSDTVVVTGGVIDIVSGAVGIFARLTGALAVLFIMEPFFFTVFIPAALLIILLTSSLRKVLKRLHKNIQEANGAVLSYLQERLNSLMIIKVFSVEKQTCDESSQKMEQHKKARIKRNYFSSLCSSGFGAIIDGGYLFGAIYCGYGILKGSISYGTFMAVLQLIGQIQSRFAGISGLVPQYYAVLASAERLMEAEHYPDDSDEASSISDHELLLFYRENFRSLGMRSVCFSYPPSGDDPSASRTAVLDHFSLEIRKGEYVAFTGHSGCGKSTLLKLLMCLYPPDEGQRYIKSCKSGEEETEYPLTAQWRRLFAYVPQGNHLMSGTIREIIAFGDPAAMSQEERLDQALRISCADEFVKELENGLDTVLGEHGSGLSEGQMQRIAIARAVFSDRPVLILDESTSALDEVTEEKLLTNLRQMTDKTVLIITHRAAALRICDRKIEMTPVSV